MSKPVIEVRKLSKRYHLGIVGATTLRDDVVRYWRRMRGLESTREANEFLALDDISFDIAIGEVVGVLGRNGAGKSTLLKILSRITEPSHGTAVLRGRVASLLEVGTGFHPDLTGRENIYLNGAILGMKRGQVATLFDEIVAFAEVEQFVDTPVKHYSSGMYVRLAFAVAAHLEPEVLIVDEVLAVGDVQFQKKCLGKMSDVARSGHTVLFVSHNLGAVRALCTRALVLNGGRLDFAGSVADALANQSLDATRHASTRWQREPAAPRPDLHFVAAQVQMHGRQPKVQLELELTLKCERPTAGCLLAIDVKDGTLTGIMQAMPTSVPFVEGKPGQHRVTLTVDLPPLIPGVYHLDLWIGRHFSETTDLVREALAFEITESPSPGRSYPHGADHGAVVPPARFEYRSTP
jgi:lipopolysaccharide transport system ATP-binding protein